MTEMVEIIEDLPNISGSEGLIEQVIRDSRTQPVFLPDSEVDFSKIQSAAAVALHMHQPLIPAGGLDLQSAAVISNLQYMFNHPTLGDNHHAPVFHWCYKRMNQFISQLVDEGQQARIMLHYSGSLLYGLRQMGFDDVFANLRPLALEPRFQRVVEWLGSTWGHALAPSTPVQDFRLHVRAWQHHFAAIFGLEALGRVRGFSLAELALPNHPDVAYEFVMTLRDCGYHWVLVQEDTVENAKTGQKAEQPHLPHLLRCTNTKGETATIIAIIKTQGSDPRLVSQMQGYYAAKALSREDLGKQSIPPLVTQIADGENSMEMMNEFPRRYFEAVREASGSATPLLNVTEYLEHLSAAGLGADLFPVVQPAGQKQIWAGFEVGDRPAKLQRLIQRLRKKDDQFQMEDGRWTNRRAWVKKQADTLDPLDQTSALFYETVLKRRVASDDPRYRKALFHLLMAQSSAFHHLREGDWAEYRSEILRRASETLTEEFKPRKATKKATQPAPQPREAVPAGAAAPEAGPETPKVAPAGPAASEAKPEPSAATPPRPAAPEAKAEAPKPAPVKAKDPVPPPEPAPLKAESPQPKPKISEPEPDKPKTRQPEPIVEESKLSLPLSGEKQADSKPVSPMPTPPESAPRTPATAPAQEKSTRLEKEAEQKKPQVSKPAAVEAEVSNPVTSQVEPVEEKTPEPAPAPPTTDKSAAPKSKQATADPAPVEAKTTASKPIGAKTASDEPDPAAAEKKTTADPKQKPSSASRKRKSR